MHETLSTGIPRRLPSGLPPPSESLWQAIIDIDIDRTPSGQDTSVALETGTTSPLIRSRPRPPSSPLAAALTPLTLMAVWMWATSHFKPSLPLPTAHSPAPARCRAPLPRARLHLALSRSHRRSRVPIASPVRGSRIFVWNVAFEVAARWGLLESNKLTLYSGIDNGGHASLYWSSPTTNTPLAPSPVSTFSSPSRPSSDPAIFRTAIGAAAAHAQGKADAAAVWTGLVLVSSSTGLREGQYALRCHRGPRHLDSRERRAGKAEKSTRSCCPSCALCGQRRRRIFRMCFEHAYSLNLDRYKPFRSPPLFADPKHIGRAQMGKRHARASPRQLPPSLSSTLTLRRASSARPTPCLGVQLEHPSRIRRRFCSRTRGGGTTTMSRIRLHDRSVSFAFKRSLLRPDPFDQQRCDHGLCSRSDSAPPPRVGPQGATATAARAHRKGVVLLLLILRLIDPQTQRDTTRSRWATPISSTIKRLLALSAVEPHAHVTLDASLSPPSSPSSDSAAPSHSIGGATEADFVRRSHARRWHTLSRFTTAVAAPRLCCTGAGVGMLERPHLQLSPFTRTRQALRILRFLRAHPPLFASTYGERATRPLLFPPPSTTTPARLCALRLSLERFPQASPSALEFGFDAASVSALRASSCIRHRAHLSGRPRRGLREEARSRSPTAPDLPFVLRMGLGSRAAIPGAAPFRPHSGLLHIVHCPHTRPPLPFACSLGWTRRFLESPHQARKCLVPRLLLSSVAIDLHAGSRSRTTIPSISAILGLSTSLSCAACPWGSVPEAAAAFPSHSGVLHTTSHPPLSSSSFHPAFRSRSRFVRSASVAPLSFARRKPRHAVPQPLLTLLLSVGFGAVLHPLASPLA
ncbi:hypothetical protein C8R45DRAFT_1224647 [Mycena sanguinolenta]|nr:hypothetical protein C8R45DRAFT_1224647 [Mycena sanguinolenta]